MNPANSRRHAALVVACVGVLSLMPGCGGGGGSSRPAANPPAPPPPPSNDSPTVEVLFPGIFSATEAEQVEIAVAAVDPDGDPITEVSASAGGTEFGFSQEPDGTWRSGSIDLALGANAITVTASDDDGGEGSADLQIERGGLLIQPRAIALTDDPDKLIVLDLGQRSLLRLDRTTGILETVSGPTVGSGSIFTQPNHFLMRDADTALVADGFVLREVDLATGDRTELVSVSATPPNIDNCCFGIGLSQ